MDNADNMFTMFTTTSSSMTEQQVEDYIKQIPISIQYFNLSAASASERTIRFIIVFNKN